MLFNSHVFAIFFAVVFGLYLLLQKHHLLQNRLLLGASFVFYGWWDWRFLFLMSLTIGIDYFVGLRLHAETEIRRRKMFLALSIVCNMSILGFFKYFNFFVSSFEILLARLGIDISAQTLHIVLPVGISFYTFQSMSYVVDVYRRQLSPAKDLGHYGTYISYFPQLVAGPIERGTHLLPQVLNPRKISLPKIYEGSYLIFWGLYQKVFIADNLARIVNPVFQAEGPYHGIVVLFAVYAFAFQIYCDFAGYSNIARGLSMCMGFDLMVNFNLPYFAQNPSDFWRRWHISLSTWLRDYLYIPLGGNRKGGRRTYLNLIVTMLLGGLWHGAAWHFVIWGAYHGLLLVFYRLFELSRRHINFGFNFHDNRFWKVLNIIFFFNLICIGWLFFRAGSMAQAIDMLKAIVAIRPVAGQGFTYFPTVYMPQLFKLLWLLLVVQFFQYIKNDLLVVLRWPVWIRVAFYLCMFYSMMLYGVHEGGDFIYFQF